MMKLRQPILLLLCCLLAPCALAFCPAFLKNQTACSCFAYTDGIVIRCNGQDGPAVVEQLKKTPIEIREMALENANIVEIGRNAFKNLRIKKLVLDNNRIRALHPDAFRGLESVMLDLSISKNKLTAIPTDSLIAMRALSVLSLRCNNIGDIKTPVFRNMSSLIDLNLGCNQICNIERSVFSDVKNTLQNLILDNNCLSAVPSDALRGLDNLIGLHMKYNQIEQLEKMQLTNLSSLTILSLTGNKISTIENDFMPQAENLRYLYLGTNNMTTIDAGVLGQFKQVQVIDLSYNYFTEITDDMFSGLEHLQHLNLEGNHIKDIAPGAFATTPLLLLWLPNNCLQSVSPNMFQGAPFLRQISLANNNIRTIQPLSFAHLANLHTLDLSHNKIQVLEPGAIIGSDYLMVRLQENSKAMMGSANTGWRPSRWRPEENPMVCLQDGFHVMNGKEAINLTTEPNLICQTNYTNDLQDVCPKNANVPHPPPCCSKSVPNTDEALSTSTTGTATASPDAFLHVRPHSVHSKKFNLERFMRLSQRPAGYRTSPFLRHRVPTLSEPINTAMLSISPKSEANEGNRSIPSRLEQRHKHLEKIRAQLPPYVRTESKGKDEIVEFVSDSHVDSVQTQDRKQQ